MKRLEVVHMVQFSFFEFESFETRGNLTLLGHNGVGKTSLLDAIQIAMLGAHGNYVAYNAQSVSSKQGGRKLRDYCLGVMRPMGNSSQSENADIGRLARKRDHAVSYITLVFSDDTKGEYLSAGICLSATIEEPDHRLKGLYVAPGIALALEDHLQAIDGGKTPLDWGSFEVELRRRASAIGRTPHISTHPEAYIEELLHAIQPAARHINRQAFARAFKKGMQLKDIENVNDFVRDYLVDAQPINKQAALAQITRFKQLKALIQETEEQIEALDKIHKNQTDLLTAHRRRDTVLAIKAKLEVEQEQEKIDDLKRQLEQSRRELSEIRPEIEILESNKKKLVSEIQDILQQIARDPASLNLENNTKMRSLLQLNLTDSKKRLNGSNLKIRQTLQAVRNAFFGELEIVSSISPLLQQFESFAKNDIPVDLPTLKQTRERLSTVQGDIIQRLNIAKQNEKDEETELNSLLGQLKAVTRGAGKLSRSTGVAIKIFHENGIEAQPICALIEIKDSRWQAAIEAFLGPHKESLVVEPGKERAAVRLLRQYRDQTDWLFQVTVVQPAHLSIQKHRSPANDTVAALIAGNNDIATTYVRQILGEMRCVETEEELERHSRALTSDGMLSANGGTRRLRLPDTEDWCIGSKFSDSQKEALYQKIKEAQELHGQAKRKCKLFEEARDSIRETLRDVELVSYNELLTTFIQTHAEIERLPDPSTIKEPKRLVALRKEKDQADTNLEEMELKLKGLRDDESSQKALADEREKLLKTAEERLGVLDSVYQEAIVAPDFDEETQFVLNKEIYAHEDKVTMFTSCQEIEKKANARIQKLTASVFPDFTHFIDRYNVALIEERSDWRKAKKWVEGRLSKLKDSELVNYKTQSEEALNAAEEAFRQDIAYRLREAIQRLEQDISQLNKILKTCPVFSGNERYEFSAEPARAYEKIYNFIKSVNKLEGASESLFAGADDARQEIIKHLEASASADSKKIDNPLEDYRLLFNFDLKIFQGEVQVGLLSERIGVASNGEHRVPFYVIAGAALATAYRIQSGKKNDGAALMLLDEAFYGMDSQNSYSTAQFLRSLGLQLVMAGPEADQGKLGPMTDSLYELTRYGSDVFLDVTHFTEKLQQLMTSDMPMLHPELIEQAEKEFVRQKA